jgi:hypothetical protein
MFLKDKKTQTMSLNIIRLTNHKVRETNNKFHIKIFTLNLNEFIDAF